MVAPQMPTGRRVGQAVLDNQPDRHGHDAMGIARLGGSQVRHIGVEILVALGATVLRIGEVNFAWPPADEIAKIAEPAGDDFISKAAFAALRARQMRVVATSLNDSWPRQILRIGYACRGISQILTGSENDNILLDRELLPRRLPTLCRSVILVCRY